MKAGQVLATLDAREAEASRGPSQGQPGGCGCPFEAGESHLRRDHSIPDPASQGQLGFGRVRPEACQELHQKDFIARQQLDEARTKYNVAKAAYDLALNSIRQKTWENDIALAEAQVRQAKASLDLNQAQLANLIILSPMNGEVTKRYVDPGTMVKDTTPILTLMDLSEVKMMVNVIEKEFVRLQKGPAGKGHGHRFPRPDFPGAHRHHHPGSGPAIPHGRNPDLHSQPGIYFEPRDVREGGDPSPVQSSGHPGPDPGPDHRGRQGFCIRCKRWEGLSPHRPEGDLSKTPSSKSSGG